MTTYTLQSSPMVYAPGLIAWAINGYAFPRDRKQLRNVIMAGWDLPEAAVKALLLKKVPYSIEGGDVVFTFPPATEG